MPTDLSKEICKQLRAIKPPETHRFRICDEMRKYMLINFNIHGMSLVQMLSIPYIRCDHGCKKAGDGQCGLWYPQRPPEGYINELREQGHKYITLDTDGKTVISEE